MQFKKQIKDIQFDDDGVSEAIVMASAAGWYVGKIDNSEGFIQPWNRYSDYFATPEEAQKELDIYA
jgi:hypothetical protein